jgi:hypothetical protein
LFAAAIEAVSKDAHQMVSVDTRYEHIVLDEHGIPHIAGTTMKVIELETAQVAYSWSPEELYFQSPPSHLGKSTPHLPITEIIAKG